MKTWLSKVFNLSILQQNRWAWVDYLRGIAIILVVYRHVLIGIERSHIDIPYVLERANMIFFSFRMPLFFILSGIFINSSIAKRTIGKLVYIKFENLLYPYIVWAFIQITIQIVMSSYTNSARSWDQYAAILYSPRHLDQFWYLPALFNTSVVYLLTKIKLKFKWWMQLILGVILYFSAHYVDETTGSSMLSDWMEYYLFFAVGDTLSAVFFKKESQDFLKKYMTFILVIPLFTITQLFYLGHPPVYYTDDPMGKIVYLPIVFIGCFSMFVLAFRLQTWDVLRFLRVVGYHSLFIYVMHVIVSAFARIVLTNAFHITNPYILLGCGILTGVTIPIIFYNLFIKDGPLWFLFTLKRPEKKEKQKEKELPRKKEELA